jgi:hypothetical protein
MLICCSFSSQNASSNIYCSSAIYVCLFVCATRTRRQGNHRLAKCQWRGEQIHLKYFTIKCYHHVASSSKTSSGSPKLALCLIQELHHPWTEHFPVYISIRRKVCNASTSKNPSASRAVPVLNLWLLASHPCQNHHMAAALNRPSVSPSKFLNRRQGRCLLIFVYYEVSLDCSSAFCIDGMKTEDGWQVSRSSRYWSFTRALTYCHNADLLFIFFTKYIF